MHIEVDQSGKIEQLDKDTYIAFSNHEQYCVKFPKRIKREIIYEYRTKVKQFIPRLFAICLFYCLKDYIRKKELITIDLEYPGWEAAIKTYLMPLLKLEYRDFDKKIIRFNMIGKESKAHKIAKSAFIEKTKPNRILDKEDVLKWLK